MKKTNIQDERIISQKRKIGSDAYTIVSLGLIISILLQQFVFQAPFSQYVVEFILFILGLIYVVLGNIIVGNNVFNDSCKGQKKIIINSIISGITIATIAIIFNIINLGLKKMGDTVDIAIIIFITSFCGTVVSFVCFEILYLVNKKRQRQIDAKYTDSDE